MICVISPTVHWRGFSVNIVIGPHEPRPTRAASHVASAKSILKLMRGKTNICEALDIVLAPKPLSIEADGHQ
ncbi:hypothetical protein GCM10023208_32450 [Erythrobacter westpacificensis]|uniref:Uncharacterized protein n=1 Tax=Erythrobacter westpacificensis TaxID=1055231 RepID=A0ABP9KRX6_9SPHN